MSKSAEQVFESLKERIEDPSNIKSIGSPRYGSPYPDCNATFFVYMHKGKGGDQHIHTSSIKKGNKIVALLNEWINSKK